MAATGGCAGGGQHQAHRMLEECTHSSSAEVWEQSGRRQRGTSMVVRCHSMNALHALAPAPLLAGCTPGWHGKQRPTCVAAAAAQPRRATGPVRCSRRAVLTRAADDQQPGA